MNGPPGPPAAVIRPLAIVLAFFGLVLVCNFVSNEFGYFTPNVDPPPLELTEEELAHFSTIEKHHKQTLAAARRYFELVATVRLLRSLHRPRTRPGVPTGSRKRHYDTWNHPFYDHIVDEHLRNIPTLTHGTYIYCEIPTQTAYRVINELSREVESSLALLRKDIARNQETPK